MKGFIEVTIMKLDGVDFAGTKLIPIRDIKRVFKFNSGRCDILDTDGNYHCVEESYNRVKELIKQAQ